MYSLSASTAVAAAEVVVVAGGVMGVGLAMTPPCITMYSSVRGLLSVEGGVVLFGLIMHRWCLGRLDILVAGQMRLAHGPVFLISVRAVLQVVLKWQGFPYCKDQSQECCVQIRAYL